MILLKTNFNNWGGGGLNFGSIRIINMKLFFKVFSNFLFYKKLVGA